MLLGRFITRQGALDAAGEGRTMGIDKRVPSFEPPSWMLCCSASPSTFIFDWPSKSLISIVTDQPLQDKCIQRRIFLLDTDYHLS